MASLADLERENKLLRSKLAICLKAIDGFIAMAKWAGKSSDELQKIRSQCQELNIVKCEG